MVFKLLEQAGIKIDLDDEPKKFKLHLSSMTTMRTK